MDLAQTGCYLEYDLFGLETSYYPDHPDFDMPNDGGRRDQILRLIEDGHARQVLMSHDIAYKHCVTKWGGFGYHHLLLNVVPRLRRKRLDDRAARAPRGQSAPRHHLRVAPHPALSPVGRGLG